MRHSLVIGLIGLVAACSGETKTITNTKTNVDTNTITNTNTNTNTVVENAQCDGAGVCVLTGVIVKDTTLTADKQWVLSGGVFVGNDIDETVLTIEPGTTIYGENSTRGMLVVTRGSKLIAEGTKDAPIVFTSSKAPGSRARGDWGGLILNGRAPINNCAEGTTGVCEQFGEGGTGYFGGTDADDSSGSLSYVRVEFAGTLISPDNELNGIAFQGVGRGTSVDYLQVHMNADDGMEFFGGTVEWKHLLVTGVGDDCLDWTDGWQGKGQFFVGQQFDDSGDQGIEADNNAEDNEASPRSTPTLSNLTLIGSPDSTSSDYGALLREGTAGSLHNVILTGFNAACLSLSQPATLDQIAGGDLTIADSILNCAVPFKSDDGNGDVLDADVQAFWELDGTNVEVDPELGAPYDLEAPDFTPAAGSPAASGAVIPAGAFFDDVAYRGGVDPADDWTLGWTIHDRN
ncbi:MAG: hypothetical protein ABMB14_26400, partial [Myxococcota bacterium]